MIFGKNNDQLFYEAKKKTSFCNEVFRFSIYLLIEVNGASILPHLNYGSPDNKSRYSFYNSCY